MDRRKNGRQAVGLAGQHQDKCTRAVGFELNEKKIELAGRRIRPDSRDCLGWMKIDGFARFASKEAEEVEE